MVHRSRRQMLLTGLAAGVAGFAGCLVGDGGDAGCTDGRTTHDADAAVPRHASWRSYQYDAGNTGYNPGASGPTDEGTVAWRYSSCTEAESGVVVADGRIYAAGVVVDGRTGQPQGGEWTGHYSTPAVADGTLYAGSHNLEARDATTGDLEWTFETDGGAGAVPAPTVADGTVYVPGNLDESTLYAVNATAGTEQWRVETEDKVGVPAAVEATTVYTVDRGNVIYALDAATGEERWRRAMSVDLWRAGPVAADGQVYFGTVDGTIVALGAAEPTVHWEQPVEFDIEHPVAVADGTVIAAGGQGRVAALDATTGEINWTRSTVDGPYTTLGAPAVTDEAIYVGVTRATESAPLVALDAATGEEQWRIETRSVSFGDYTAAGIVDGPAVVDGVVAAATVTGDLYVVAGP